MRNDLVGSSLGQYQVLEPVGEGSMSSVYRAYQPSLDRFVAIKVLIAGQSEGGDFAPRFRREARAIARLEHPNILPIFDFGEHGQVLFIVTPFVEGGVLKDFLGRRRPLSWALGICFQLASALDYAHAQRVLHRDVKPANVLMGKDGRPFLADFGLAKLVGESQITLERVTMGTPEYMSPEQCQGLDLDGRTDQYALAIMMFEMLTGTVPYGGGSVLAVAAKQIQEPVPSVQAFNPSISVACDSIVQRALAKDREERWASCTEFVEQLRQAAGDATASVARPGYRPPFSPKPAVPQQDDTEPLLPLPPSSAERLRSAPEARDAPTPKP